MNKVATILPLALVALASAEAVTGGTCPDGTTPSAIYYINGMNNEQWEARDSTNELSAKAEALLGVNPPATGCFLEVRLAYNQNEAFFDEVVEATLQRLSGDFRQLWRFWAGLDTAPMWFLNLARAFTTTYDALTYINSTDLQEHVALYEAALGARVKVILVPHSQGNFYANDAYGVLDTVRSIQQSNLEVVATATPASFVAGDGPYTTLIEDLVIGLLAPLAKPPNETNGLPLICDDDWKCHKFVPTYILGANSGPKILAEIRQAIGRVCEEGSDDDTISRINDMLGPRGFHCSVRLQDGRVLLAGGNSLSLDFPLATAEIFDPATNAFSAAASLNSARGKGVSCALLGDGRVLAMGGSLARFTYTETAEIYDPEADSWTTVGSMTTPRSEGWGAFRVPSGEVLALGGTYEGSRGSATNAVDRFDPSTQTFSPAGTLEGARRDYEAELFNDGSILLVGGVRNFSAEASPVAEIYDATTNEAHETATQPVFQPRRGDTTLAPISEDEVLLVGGSALPAEIFDISSETFRPVPHSPLFFNGAFGQSVALEDGRVLVLGFGRQPTDQGRIAELFDPESGRFTAVGSLDVASPCVGYRATLLTNGHVLVTGGGIDPGNCEKGSVVAEVFAPRCGPVEEPPQAPGEQQPEVSTLGLWHMNGPSGSPGKLDNAEGSSAFDLLAAGDPASAQGFNGAGDGAFELDGATQYFSLAVPPPRDQDLTWMGWIYLGQEPVTSSQPLIHMEQSGSTGQPIASMEVTGSGTLAGFFTASRSNQVIIETSLPVPRNEWVHVALTRDDGFYALYVSGVQEAIVSTATNSDIVVSSQAYLGHRFNTSYPTNRRYFDGRLDEWHVIHGRAWTAQEIADYVASATQGP